MPQASETMKYQIIAPEETYMTEEGVTFRKRALEQSVTISPAPSSSVEITTDSKGQAKLAVKVYSESPDDALQTALRLYKEGVMQLAS